MRISDWSSYVCSSDLKTNSGQELPPALVMIVRHMQHQVCQINGIAGPQALGGAGLARAQFGHHGTGSVRYLLGRPDEVGARTTISGRDLGPVLRHHQGTDEVVQAILRNFGDPREDGRFQLEIGSASGRERVGTYV